MSIRGFQDGQYNVTLDGIPFGDSNNYTHHSSSYFVNRDLADVEVDRGPGTASTIGNATFGGTIGLVTKDPAKDATFTPFASGGSFGTVLYGAQLDTGTLPGGGSAVIDGEGTSTDGAETHANAQRQNIFAKFTQPVGDTTTLTIEGMYNASDIAFWRGASRAQIAAFGSDYAFTDIPGTDDYYKYWTTDTHADFEYARIQSKLSDHWSLDTSVYTYAYSNDAHRPIDGTGSTVGTIYGATDIPGITQINEYRAFGDVIRLTRAFSLAGMTGDLKFGGWVEHQENAVGAIGNLLDQQIVDRADGAVDRLVGCHRTDPVIRGAQFEVHRIGKIQCEAHHSECDPEHDDEDGTPPSAAQTLIVGASSHWLVRV